MVFIPLITSLVIHRDRGTQSEMSPRPRIPVLPTQTRPLLCACTAPGPLPQAGPRGHGSHRDCGPLSQDTGTTSPWLAQPLPNRDKSILLSLSCRSLWALGSSLSYPEPSTVLPSPKLRAIADSFRISPTQVAAPSASCRPQGQAGCGERLQGFTYRCGDLTGSSAGPRGGVSQRGSCSPELLT